MHRVDGEFLERSPQLVYPPIIEEWDELLMGVVGHLPIVAYSAGAKSGVQCDDGSMRRSRSHEAVLITTAPESNDDGYDRRRKTYAIMMALRALCVVAAALTYRVSIFLALGFIVGGVVLPWCAVIIANDRPAKRRARHPFLRTGYGQERALGPADDDRTVDG